ncbi:hypothetical protein [Flavobacterium sp. DG2-3]|uniref:hypothetical protein n=1 Tax=Flavobacterium sp. DG2-3 TaxID=3068317 RepID=UPI00273D985E|nr:hypothetical protein [Flavobacterium sp. DG2-3]MDP5202037.1 hypothetical protein [Flavobacterium sp. DG2-3]
MKIIFAMFFLLFGKWAVLAQNDLSPSDNVTIGIKSGYVGNSLIFNGWGENHLIRTESIGNIANGHSRLRVYLADDWTYDQGFEIIAQRYDGPLRTLLYIPGDGSQTNFFSGASFGGNVGIGTINPTNKLDVNGTIHSKEVKVDMTGWSDFVFKKEYNLPTLEEVEKHIVENGHLENIPNEEEVLKNGINLGEMNSKLLQKIEELTLYMIEMKKENIQMKKENLSIKTNQIELEKQIKTLKNK